MVLWMKVSNDKYELPEIVADTSAELSRLCGLKHDSGVLSAIANAKRRGHKCRFVKVVIDEEDEDDK